MPEPTDADRAKAAELMTFTHRGQHVFRWSDERITFADDDPYYAEGVNAIASALADARAEADQLRDAMRAEAWDEGFEAGATWTPSGPAGVPHDPPTNPYAARSVIR